MVRALTLVAACAALLVFAGATEAGKLKNGDPAPVFSKLETTDGKFISLGDFKKDILVICITCNHCPVAKAYEDRNIDFVKRHGNKVDFVAINVNNLEADKMPAMKVRAQEKKFNFPYAYDPSQKIARDLDANFTPEYFVFNKERKLVYQGAMDDNQNPKDAKVNYLDQVVIALSSGGTVPASTKARGCTIKFDK